MESGTELDELISKNDQLRDISIIAGRNISGLLGIAEWIEEPGHRREGGAGRAPAHQLEEVGGGLGAIAVVPE